MSEKLPKMPEPPSFRLQWGGSVVAVGDCRKFAESYARETWMRAMEVAASACEEERPNAPGPYCPWSDEDEARYQAFTDCAAAIRALPMPEGGE
jgi:hypothetical protein